MVKYILVTGGVLSGVGKGVIASSIGRLFKELGFAVTSIKIDPYINIDAGTMSPFEHGEVYVLDDGGEVDLDLGNYERFMDCTLTRDHNLTTGKIYNYVIQKERKGAYLGKTVQVVPHVTNEIQDWIERVSKIPTSSEKEPDICVIELGGTVGDIESMPFVEAMRQFQFRVGKNSFCEVHVSLVPVIGVVGEQKTKPTQHTVKELRSLGLNPDFVVCRSEHPLTESTKQKIASFCHVESHEVIGIHNVPNVYNVPLLIASQNVHKGILEKFKLHSIPNPEGDKLLHWVEYSKRYDEVMKTKEEDAIHIAIVGKYTGLTDAYISIERALKDAGVNVGRKAVIDWIESTDLELPPTEEAYQAAWKILTEKADGLIIPGGFGDRGIEGKIKAATYARTHNLPFLGICLGFQLAVIEFARNVVGIADATSEEFTTSKYGDENSSSTSATSSIQSTIKSGTHAVVFMPEISLTHMGGTMRLGKRKTVFQDDKSQMFKLYGSHKVVEERHRHRYEVNPQLVPQIEAKGMMFVGQDETGQRMQIMELKGHDYYVGTQFHPEFLSRPFRPSPPFLGLVQAANKVTKK